MLSRPRRERGQALVEYALILPLLLLIILGIVEFAIVIWSYNTIANAAREGARKAIIYPYDLNAAEGTVRARALGLDQSSLQVTSSLSVISGPVHITVTYGVDLMTGPIIQAAGGSDVLQLGTVASMHIE